MKRICTLIAIAAISISSYANAPKQDSLRLKNTITAYSNGDIDISLSYPQLSHSDKTIEVIQTLAQSINADVCRLIANIIPAPDNTKKDSLWQKVSSPTLLELYALSAANAVLDEQKGYGGPSAYDLFSEWTAFGNEQIVSIFIKTYMFAGGAHGMTIGRALNYNVKTGARLDMIKMIEDTAFLMDLAAINFCKERKLPKKAIKLQTGLFYELADLPLADEIGFTPKGMILYYDPYSIAPYSYGPITITIPYKDLKNVVTEDFFKMQMTAGGAKSYNEKTKKIEKR